MQLHSSRKYKLLVQAHMLHSYKVAEYNLHMLQKLHITHVTATLVAEDTVVIII